MRVECASLSDVGQRRSRNEDALYADSAGGLFIVADGMGGHPAGDVASRLAIDELTQRLQPAELDAAKSLPQLLEQAIQQCDAAILQAGRDNPAWHRMGTTVVVLVYRNGAAYIANVGDSRAYLLRGGEFGQCSRDDNLAADGQGTSQLANILTQALGLDLPLNVHQSQHPLRAGDRLLLCSDGLSGMLSDDRIRELIAPPTELKESCRRLIASANSQGGLDNISVVLVEITD